MVLGAGNKCIKYLVFIFNFLVFVVGGAILGVALSIIFDKNAMKTFQDLINKGKVDISLTQMNIPLYVLAAIGGLLLLCGFLGCCGACMENTCLLGVFFSIVLVLFVAELACGIAILVARQPIKDGMYKGIKEKIGNYTKIPPSEKEAIDEMQKNMKCCGCETWTEYGPNPMIDPPTSCFKDGIKTPPPFANGCCNELWDGLWKNAAIVGGVAIGILVIELLAMIFSCILCQAFKRGDYQYA